jgi:hypothetical protein
MPVHDWTHVAAGIFHAFPCVIRQHKPEAPARDRRFLRWRLRLVLPVGTDSASRAFRGDMPSATR